MFLESSPAGAELNVILPIELTNYARENGLI
jgi:hypothetical protein